MFKFFLMLSRHGKVRLAKWFESYSHHERQRICRDVASLVLPRRASWSNIVDYHGGAGARTASASASSSLPPSHAAAAYAAPLRLVYKRYASLYVIVCVDAGTDGGASTNELLALDMIHLYVEALDRYFGNVCELDLIFNFPQAYYMLDEVFAAGEFQESSKDAMLRSVQTSDSLAGQERDDQARR